MDTLSVPQTEWDIAGRLALAVLFGGALGVNREWQGKPAGLRTHCLVALGGALFIVTGLLLAGDVSATGRIIQGITAGVGFIGAGVILRRPEVQDVQGLTTAATIWIVSAVGVAAGAGLWRTCIAAVVLAFVVLILGEKIDGWVHRKR